MKEWILGHRKCSFCLAIHLDLSLYLSLKQWIDPSGALALCSKGRARTGPAHKPPDTDKDLYWYAILQPPRRRHLIPLGPVHKAVMADSSHLQPKAKNSPGMILNGWGGGGGGGGALLSIKWRWRRRCETCRLHESMQQSNDNTGTKGAILLSPSAGPWLRTSNEFGL